ncbi:hypothetical protein [Flagellimonas onchidii]|uniref:hypothetical protein n=1 Tax=Flagellimonas onchidii TaxID=2562684 RepID=UPI0010A61594|nr:hypothetical protein [Allomuricauda onchidii]
MFTKTTKPVILVLGILSITCKNTKKEQEDLNQKLEHIQAIETSIDSTIKSVNEKAKELEGVILELDSI